MTLGGGYFEALGISEDKEGPLAPEKVEEENFESC